MLIKQLTDLIKYAIWGEGSPVISKDVYEEMKQQAIVALPASCLHSLSLPSELATEWKKDIVRQISFYSLYCLEQTKLPVAVPYVILKGTSAAKYYPYPEYRMMGDIDIMTSREDFETACKQLMDNGYEMIKEIEDESN